MELAGMLDSKMDLSAKTMVEMMVEMTVEKMVVRWDL